MFERTRAAFRAFFSSPKETPSQEDGDFREAVNVNIDADESEWRKLTGDSSRDLSPLTLERSQEISYYLWEQNLVANRMIELEVAYIFGEGFSIKADDNEVQGWIDSFINHPTNKLKSKFPKKMRELKLFGNQVWPTFVNDVNGQVRLGYLDPVQIAQIITDPDNIEQPIGVTTKKNHKGEYKRYRVIVNGDEEELFTDRTRRIREQFTDGDIFFYKINDLSNSKFGRPDLLAQADWLDGYDQFLFGEMDRAQFLRAFVWTLEIAGATEDEINNWARKIAPPKPNSVQITNDKMKWDASTPGLQAADTSELAKTLRNHSLGGATMPTHWYGGTDDVNRSSGESMGEPTFKMYSMRQNLAGEILSDMISYVIRQRVLAKDGSEPDLNEDRYKFEVQWPEMTSRDTTKYASALQQVVVAAAMAIDRGLLSEETGLQIVEKISGRLGVGFDVTEELQAARDELAARSEQDVFTGNNNIDPGVNGGQANAA